MKAHPDGESADTLYVGYLFAILALISAASFLSDGHLALGRSTLLRLLIPSWRFYEQVGDPVCLSIRTHRNEQWEELFTPTATHPYLYNPHGNFRLACRGLIGALMDEVGTTAPERISNLVSYRLVVNLLKKHHIGDSPYFQFRLSHALTGEELLFSSWHRR